MDAVARFRPPLLIAWLVTAATVIAVWLPERPAVVPDIPLRHPAPVYRDLILGSWQYAA